ncbi:FHA domain-containing protein [Nocardia sp. 2]|uniref:FHA domain-containing protein n=1 Tax=Nocardia acididurans TaxID=2802282 RepID=A0ABS1M0U0_9NOCA|nr:FHA domain-containing protein [Nocardia acididurans]MBL1074282.1 FHA domain-containing protein [Nocardia acididurans]
MAACPKGHESDATDYCDICGWPMEQSAAPGGPQTVACPECGVPVDGRFCENCGYDIVLGGPQPRPGTSAPAPPSSTPAPSSGTPPAPGSAMRYPVPQPVSVESDPHEIEGRTIGPPPPGLTWVATITSDRAHFDRMRAQNGPDLARVEFPDYYPERRILLNGTDILIGKSSGSQGLHPEIDLSIPPSDIAVSRSHAVLHTTGDALTVTDLGSTNGTCLNGSARPIPAKTPVPLRHGDRIHLGGWTTITVTLESR